jgi:hypothetical protein
MNTESLESKVKESLGKPRKKFAPSQWQIHLKKVIDENKGSGKNLPEITKMASETYKKAPSKKKGKMESSQ